MLQRKSVVVLSVGALAIVAVAAVGLTGESENREAFRTAKVERGNVLKSVSASGELGAVITVKVGSEISGQVSALMADFNSEVKAGQVIARIDPESFEARVSQAEAELAVGEATVSIKSAAVGQARANFANARAQLKVEGADLNRAKVTSADLELDFNRKRRLRERGVVAVSAVDKARAAWEASLQQVVAAEARLIAQKSTILARQAQLRISEAEVVHAGAQVEQKAAALKVAKVSLNNTFIRSPVDGVVIGRDVDVGQTVAASLQAPILFTIAQDLRKMQVKTNIDEADIGQIRTGQIAAFTVDSFPGQEFRGSVTQIRKQPQNVQNVVTYTVVIAADNADLRLLPGMTANVEVKVSDRPGVLRIPNTALRFNPPGVAPPATAGGGGFKGGGKRGKGSANKAKRRAQAQSRLDRLAKNLSLTEDQKGQVQEISRGTFRRIISLRRNGVRGEEFQTAARELRQQSSKDILAILKPDQQVKYRAILAERQSNPTRRGRVWVMDDGKPKAVNVFIGVGDGKFTEFVRGGLTEGQQVLVGIDRTGNNQASGFRRFGF